MFKLIFFVCCVIAVVGGGGIVQRSYVPQGERIALSLDDNGLVIGMFDPDGLQFGLLFLVLGLVGLYFLARKA